MQRNLFLVFSLGSAMFLEYSSQLPQSLIAYMGVCLSSTVICASETWFLSVCDASAAAQELWEKRSGYSTGKTEM